MKKHTGQIIAAMLMLTGSQIATAGGSTAYDELSGMMISAGVPAPGRTDTNIPVPTLKLTPTQKIERYDLLLKEGKLSQGEYDSLLAGLRDLANMEALANGGPVPYPELMPSEPQHPTSGQMTARYKMLLDGGSISREEYDWLMGGLNALGQVDKSGPVSALDIGNRAHKTVWTTLRITGQLDAVFADAGDRKIAGFPVWREGDADRVAAQLAERMDGIFVNVRGAKRDVPESLEYIARFLVIGRDGKDVLWLADKIDDLYTLWGE